MRDSSTLNRQTPECRGCCHNNTPHCLKHLDQPNMYVRVLFVDFSSAFNMVIPHKLIHKLSNLGIGSSLCTWILDFLRPQNIRMGGCTSFTLILNTGTPQGCVLCPSSTPSSPTTASPYTPQTTSLNLLMTQP